VLILAITAGLVWLPSVVQAGLTAIAIDWPIVQPGPFGPIPLPRPSAYPIGHGSRAP
jgi:hypothetical protein